jgi:CRISPR-associated protein Cas1
MPTLYVTEPGARVEKEYGRILVTKDDEALVRVPIQNVTAVMLVGSGAGVTTQAMHSLLHRQVPLFLVKTNGDLIGRLAPAHGYHLALRQAQYRRNDDADFSLQLSRRIVAGKIHNQRVLAGRILRRREDSSSTKALAKLKNAENDAFACKSMDSLLGIEGSAARTYFDILGSAFDPAWKFDKRTRRPPRDPVNALLSLGYVFLGYSMCAALETAGLDPYLGYFHREDYGRPALALDLIEEFRSPVVDSLALGLVKRRLLEKKDFIGNDAEGIRLTPRGLRLFFREFSDKLESRVTVRRIGRPLSYRKLLEVQARRLANVLLGKEPEYIPYEAR